MLSWLPGRYQLFIPCLLVAAYAAPIVGALLPDQTDELTESYEPQKTLVFVYTHGKAVHKWGPLPNILYAPFYAPWLSYWYLEHEFSKPSGSFLSSFAHPFEQLGRLILVARCVGLLVALGAIGLYSRALARISAAPAAALCAIVLCVATAPDLIYEFAVTKPDGLMMAALALAMAVYGHILVEGFTLRRGVLLSLAAVASVSCKEQAAPALAGMYAWIFLAAFPLHRRFLKDYARALLIGVAIYFVINVFYAPSSWWQHIQYWIAGAGKDPAVWAASGYTRSAYLKDALNGILFNLGPGGSVAVLAAALGSVYFRSRTILGAWVPVATYLAVLIATAGYMPRYFLLPVTVLTALPVALLLAKFIDAAVALPRLRMSLPLGLVVLVGLNLWEGNMAWAQVRQTTGWMLEHYSASGIAPNQSVNLANPWRVPAGSSRLSYLGYRVDDRPLGALMQRPGDLPDFILLSRDWENWLLDFKNRPARNEAYQDTGYSYSEFQGIKALGYRLEAVVSPQLPFFLEFRWFPWPPNRLKENGDLLVYRRISGNP